MRKRNLATKLKRTLSLTLVATMLLTSTPVQEVHAANSSDTSTEVTTEASEPSSAATTEVTTETTEVVTEATTEATTETTSEVTTETTTEAITEETSEEVVSSNSDIINTDNTEVSTEMTSEENTSTSAPTETDDSEVIEEEELESKEAANLYDHIHCVSSHDADNPSWCEWKLKNKGTVLYCLDRGSTMKDGIAVYSEDLAGVMRNEAGCILSTLTSFNLGYKDTQYDLWRYYGKCTTTTKYKNRVKYSKCVFTVNNSLKKSGSELTYDIPKEVLTEADITNLFNGNEVVKTFSYTNSQLKNIQELIASSRAEGVVNHFPLALQVESKGAAILEIEGIDNCEANPNKAFSFKVHYKVPDATNRTTFPNENAIVTYINNNGSFKLATPSFTVGTGLKYISWTCADYKVRTGSGGSYNVTELQKLSYDFEKTTKKASITFSTEGKAGTTPGEYDFHLLKLDSYGNVYLNDGLFELKQGGVSKGQLNTYNSYMTGWKLSAPAMTDNMSSNDYIAARDSGAISLYEIEAPTGTVDYYSSTTDLTFNLFALKINGVVGLYSLTGYQSLFKTDINNPVTLTVDYGSYTSVISFYKVTGPLTTDGHVPNAMAIFTPNGGVFATKGNAPKGGSISVAPKNIKVATGYDNAKHEFIYEYKPIRGVKFNVLLETPIYDDTGLPYILNSTTSLGPDMVGKVIKSGYTDGTGNLSFSNLPEGTYRVEEDIANSNISDELKAELAPAAAAIGQKMVTVENNKTTTVSFSFSNENKKDTMSVNKELTIKVPVQKIYKPKASSTDPATPIKGAEFTMYMDKDYKNVLGESVFANLETEPAIVGVVNHEPIYEKGKWVKVATGTSDDNGMVNFNIECPKYDSTKAAVLIAETGVPEGQRRADYAKNTYVTTLSTLYNSLTNTYTDENGNTVTYYNAYNGYAVTLPTQKFLNEDEAAMKIKVYKYGERISGSTLKTTEYGNYYQIDRTEQISLDGVIFDIINSKGDVVETVTTDANGCAETSVKLSAATYTIRESKLNKKFHVNDTDNTKDDYWEKTVTLKPDETKEVTVFLSSFINHGIPVTLQINKKAEVPTINPTNPTGEDLSLVVNNNETDSEKMLSLVRQTYTYNNENIAGVVFGIYTKDAITAYDGTVVVPAGACVGITTTDANGKAEITHKYPSGDYYFKEIKTADNSKYKFDDKEYPFTITLNGEEKIDMNLTATGPLVNEMYKGSVTIIKKNKKKNLYLKGVTVGLYDENKNLISTAYTDNSGKCSWYNLPAGKYYVKELKALKDYDLNKTEYPVYVTKDNLDVSKIIDNNETSGRIKVIKKDADDNTILIAGVTFNLLDKDKKFIETYETDKNGEIETDSLPLGKYYLVETRAARGYILDNTEKVVDITNDNRYPEITVLNKPTKGSIKVIKTDETKTIYLKGVVFNFYDGNHKFIASYTTDSNGEIYINDLRTGTYYLQETVTNKGYILDDSLLQVDLTDSNLDVILNIVNKKEKTKSVSLDSDSDTSASDRSESVVKTGDKPIWFLFIGMFIALIFGFILYKKKKLLKSIKILTLFVFIFSVGIIPAFTTNATSGNDFVYNFSPGGKYSVLYKGQIYNTDANGVLTIPNETASNINVSLVSMPVNYRFVKKVESHNAYSISNIEHVYFDNLYGDITDYNNSIIKSDPSYIFNYDTIYGNSGNLHLQNNGSGFGDLTHLHENPIKPYDFMIFSVSKTQNNNQTLFEIESKERTWRYSFNPIFSMGLYIADVRAAGSSEKYYALVCDYIGLEKSKIIYCAEASSKDEFVNSCMTFLINENSNNFSSLFNETDTEMRQLKDNYVPISCFRYSNNVFVNHKAFAIINPYPNSIICYSCNAEYSSTEDTCPRCGRENKAFTTCSACNKKYLNVFEKCPYCNYSSGYSNKTTCYACTHTYDSYKQKCDNCNSANPAFLSIKDAGIFTQAFNIKNITGFVGTTRAEINFDFANCTDFNKMCDFYSNPFASADIIKATPTNKNGFDYDGSAFYPDGFGGKFYDYNLTCFKWGNYFYIIPTYYDKNHNVLDLKDYDVYAPVYSFYKVNKNVTVDNITYHLDNDYHATIKNVSDNNTLVIPTEVKDSIGTFSVTSINCEINNNVTSVYIPNTLKDIGTSLKDSSVKDIYADAPLFSLDNAFNNNMTIHCYKDSDFSKAVIAKYPEIDISYYNIPISYHLDGGTLEDNAPKSLYYRQTVGIPTPTKEGYEFAGWFEDETLLIPASTTPYFEDVDDSDPTELNYYAKWVAVPTTKPVEVVKPDFGECVKDISLAESESEKAAETRETTKANNKKKSLENAKANEEANKNLVKAKTETVPAVEKTAKSGSVSFKQVKGRKIVASFKHSSVNGYELKYSTNKKFKKAKTFTVVITDDKSSETLTIKKLILNKKYYVKVRAFNLKVDGTRTYGKWTKAKVIKIKK